MQAHNCRLNPLRDFFNRCCHRSRASNLDMIGADKQTPPSNAGYTGYRPWPAPWPSQSVSAIPHLTRTTPCLTKAAPGLTRETPPGPQPPAVATPAWQQASPHCPSAAAAAATAAVAEVAVLTAAADPLSKMSCPPFRLTPNGRQMVRLRRRQRHCAQQRCAQKVSRARTRTGGDATSMLAMHGTS